MGGMILKKIYTPEIVPRQMWEINSESIVDFLILNLLYFFK